MTAAANAPILVGVAQVTQRIEAPGTGKEPIDLMIDAVRLAAADAGPQALLGAATSVRTIRGLWPYENPAAAVANAIGVSGAETVLTPYGGNYVQTTVSQSCLDIQAGRHELIVLTGAECGNSQAKARRAGIDLNWQTLPGAPDRLIGDDKYMRHEFERKLGLGQPIQMYALFENALRHHLGEDIETHQRRISELWAGFSRVAADNPNAWLRDPVSAETIRTPGPGNRPVSFPYPKLMNSNNNVDQGAALILCSVGKARQLGIEPSRWIYPHAGTDAHDTLYVSNRDNLYSSPAIRIAGRRALELATIGVEDLDLVDVYSCFPVAVQVAARELGLDTSKPLTVTGGLTFAGGPLNNFVMHSIARTVELLRDGTARLGLVTANGGLLTKHAFGIYGTEPPDRPFQHEDLQTQVDQQPRRELAAKFDGTATVEGYSVMYGPEGISHGQIAARLSDGRRTWANCADIDTLQAMTEAEFCGRDVHIAAHVASF